MSRKDNDINQINLLYDECINYLKSVKHAHEVLAMDVKQNIDFDEHYREMLENIQLKDVKANKEDNSDNNIPDDDSIDESATESDSRIDVLEMKTDYEVVNELKPIQDGEDGKSQRLRKLSATLPKIIITNSNTSLHTNNIEEIKSKSTNDLENHKPLRKNSAVKQRRVANSGRPMCHRLRGGYAAWYPKRLVSKSGLENVALISNVPYEKIRLLNDTFHTLINLRWRWIVSGTIVVHFAIWLVFAVCWYVAALAHYDFEPDPPQRACVTGGHDFTTIFLASVEAQTTIGFGDRTIDEECPESIFLFIMQLIMGTGLSGVLTCVVYAKLTRPEKLSRDGVGFSKKAVISMRDGKLCLMLRAWDLNYDHIISSEFCAHFVKTHRTKEGEVIRYYARSLELSQRQFLLWPVTLVHVIDEQSPLYDMTPQQFANCNYEITVSLKGASASMGTFTQSQTSYLPREVAWGFRLPSVVKYDSRQQKYVIEHKKLDEIEVVDTPMCSARQLHHSTIEKSDSPPAPPMSPSTPAAPSPSSFSERVSSFRLERTSSFRRRAEKAERTDKVERPEGNSQALVPWTANGHVQLRKLAQ